MRDEKVMRLINALEPAAEANGFEVVDAEILGSAGAPILRIYLDREEGIDLDAIAEAQQEWLEPIVDEVDIIDGNYVLEVSSPGIDRPLRTAGHFERFTGEQVKITTEPLDGRKRFSGTLVGMEGGDVIVESSEGERFALPLDAIVKARVKGDVEFK